MPSLNNAESRRFRQINIRFFIACLVAELSFLTGIGCLILTFYQVGEDEGNRAGFKAVMVTGIVASTLSLGLVICSFILWQQRRAARTRLFHLESDYRFFRVMSDDWVPLPPYSDPAQESDHDHNPQRSTSPGPQRQEDIPLVAVPPRAEFPLRTESLNWRDRTTATSEPSALTQLLQPPATPSRDHRHLGNTAAAGSSRPFHFACTPSRHRRIPSGSTTSEDISPSRPLNTAGTPTKHGRHLSGGSSATSTPNKNKPLPPRPVLDHELLSHKPDDEDEDESRRSEGTQNALPPRSNTPEVWWNLTPERNRISSALREAGEPSASQFDDSDSSGHDNDNDDSADGTRNDELNDTGATRSVAFTACSRPIAPPHRVTPTDTDSDNNGRESFIHFLQSATRARARRWSRSELLEMRERELSTIFEEEGSESASRRGDWEDDDEDEYFDARSDPGESVKGGRDLITRPRTRSL